MNCSECGYIHAPHTVEDVQTPGFLDKFILHQNHLIHLGEATLTACKEFFYLHKKRIQLENYNYKHGKLSESRQIEWNALEPNYIKSREKRTENLQKFIDVCKHENLPIPDWVKEHKWLTV